MAFSKDLKSSDSPSHISLDGEEPQVGTEASPPETTTGANVGGAAAGTDQTI